MPTSEVESLRRRLIQIGTNLNNYQSQLAEVQMRMRELGATTVTGATKKIKKNKALIKKNNDKIAVLLDRAEDIMEDSGL